MSAQATDSKTRWTVSPYYAPHEGADPLGVFRIKEVEAEAQKWEDTLPDTEPGSEEEQSALDRREAVTESARRLIAAAPDLLAALRNVAEIMSGADYSHVKADMVRAICRRAISKAEGRAGE